MQDKNLVNVNLTKEMKNQLYRLCYECYRIAGSPDVRDGVQKPVHRRILYGMNELGSYT